MTDIEKNNILATVKILTDRAMLDLKEMKIVQCFLALQELLNYLKTMK